MFYVQILLEINRAARKLFTVNCIDFYSRHIAVHHKMALTTARRWQPSQGRLGPKYREPSPSIWFLRSSVKFYIIFCVEAKLTMKFCGISGKRLSHSVRICRWICWNKCSLLEIVSEMAKMPSGLFCWKIVGLFCMLYEQVCTISIHSDKEIKYYNRQMYSKSIFMLKMLFV